MKFKAVVANRLHDPVRTFLEAHADVVMNDDAEPWTNAGLLARCADADAIMVFMTETIDAEFLDACPNLKVVAGALKGYNNIDVAACSARSVAVTIVPDLLTEPTAELAIGLMIAVARNIVPGDSFVRSGEFQGWRPRFYGGSIDGATVAVIGAGAVGRTVLRMLKGFNCQRLYVDKRPLAGECEAELDCRQVALDEALREADFVVLGLHLMPETLHLVDADFIARMKPGSYLINPARGSVVDERAVADALASGHLAGYAADTFEMEDWTLADRPQSIDGRLLASERTVLTPHIGSAVSNVRQAIERSAAESIVAVARGEIPATAVNSDRLRDR